jgi:hypothetical protein
MTAQQAVGLAGRLFAIWLALGAFQSWAVARALHAEGALDGSWLPYSLPAIYWIAAVMLWFFPLSIAHRLVPRTRFQDRMALPSQQVVVVACVVLGLAVILLRALPALAAYVVTASLWIAAGQPISAMDAEQHVNAWVGAIQLAVGLAFVLKADALAERIRGAGAGERRAVAPGVADSAL